MLCCMSVCCHWRSNSAMNKISGCNKTAAIEAKCVQIRRNPTAYVLLCFLWSGSSRIVTLGRLLQLQRCVMHHWTGCHFTVQRLHHHRNTSSTNQPTTEQPICSALWTCIFRVARFSSRRNQVDTTERMTTTFGRSFVTASLSCRRLTSTFTLWRCRGGVGWGVGGGKVPSSLLYFVSQ